MILEVKNMQMQLFDLEYDAVEKKEKYVDRWSKVSIGSEGVSEAEIV